MARKFPLPLAILVVFAVLGLSIYTGIFSIPGNIIGQEFSSNSGTSVAGTLEGAHRWELQTTFGNKATLAGQPSILLFNSVTPIVKRQCGTNPVEVSSMPYYDIQLLVDNDVIFTGHGNQRIDPSVGLNNYPWGCVGYISSSGSCIYNGAGWGLLQGAQQPFGVDFTVPSTMSGYVNLQARYVKNVKLQGTGSVGTDCEEIVPEPNPQSVTFMNTSIYVEPSACANTSDYVLKLLTLKSGTEVSLNPNTNQLTLPVGDGNLQVSSPVFCHTIPVFRYKQDQLLGQDYTPYDSLTNGGYFKVPSDEVWVFFYKTTPDSSLVNTCLPDANGRVGVYDSVNNVCKIPPTIEYGPCMGQFDPNRPGVCITQTTSEYICIDPAAGYNQSTGFCEKIIYDTNVTTQYNCSGTIVQNGGTTICQMPSTSQLVCTDGGILEGDHCVKYLVPTQINPISTSNGLIFPILVGFGVILVVWYALRRKK